LSLNLEEIQELSGKMEKQTKALKNQLYKLCWYMRGSLSFSEAFDLSLEDIEIISEIIKDNLETTKKTQMPFF
jgi:tRNA U34 5-carboxymethylaminomethyl modifying GTPase MnmE/TrmE